MNAMLRLSAAPTTLATQHSAGENAETAQLIRLGLKELAK
ncbi:hypothetical protein V1294_001624 [Bradyrhizobium sp. AZCC 1678]